MRHGVLSQERRRIERTGAIVSPMRNREGAFVGPHRVFGPDGFAPGLAMSRSLGDLLAHSLGVCPLPITSQRRLTSQDQFVVRVWHYLNHSPGSVTQC